MAVEIATLTGEFEKPRFFNYKATLCAHSRSKQPGCNQCIDVCSAEAIRSDGDRIFVEPHLCVGCGACTTVCPSGALTYAYPTVPDLGARLKTLLSTYAKAGGRDACIMLHAEGQSRRDRPAGAPGQGAAGSGHSGGSAAHRLGGPRRMARGAGVGRVADRRAGDRRRGARIPCRAGVPDAAGRYDSQRARLSGRALPDRRRRRRRRVRTRGLGVAGGADRARRRHLCADSREADDDRSCAGPPCAACAGAAAGHPVAERRSLRRHRHQRRHVHDVPGLRGLVPRGRDSGQHGSAAGALHRDQVRAMRHLRGDLSGTRDHVDSAPQPRAGREGRRSC